MAKLERLAQLAKKKTLFDDRPVEVEELTFVRWRSQDDPLSSPN